MCRPCCQKCKHGGPQIPLLNMNGMRKYRMKKVHKIYKHHQNIHSFIHAATWKKVIVNLILEISSYDEWLQTSSWRLVTDTILTCSSFKPENMKMWKYHIYSWQQGDNNPKDLDVDVVMTMLKMMMVNTTCKFDNQTIVHLATYSKDTRGWCPGMRLFWWKRNSWRSLMLRIIHGGVIIVGGLHLHLNEFNISYNGWRR